MCNYKHFKNCFYVSDKGKVKRVRNGKRVSVDIYTSSKGYKYFILFNSMDKEKVYVNRAVAKLFVAQSSPDKFIVDHINRDRTDNKASNLRWVTRSENDKNRRELAIPWWLLMVPFCWRVQL